MLSSLREVVESVYPGNTYEDSLEQFMQNYVHSGNNYRDVRFTKAGKQLMNATTGEFSQATLNIINVPQWYFPQTTIDLIVELTGWKAVYS